MNASQGRPPGSADGRTHLHRTAAHQYLDAGYMPVGWVIIDGRKAAVSMKGKRYADYSITHAEIDKWSWRWQTGLAMCEPSGNWARDFDCGPERAAEFCEQNFVSRTAVNLTGRGFHEVYRGTGGCPWPRDGVWSADWMDVQVRSNGFIAVWPSIHPNGKQYRWLDSHPVAEPGSMLLGFRPERQPRHLSGRGGPSRDGGPDGDLAWYAQHGIPVGWQDTELHRLACKHTRSMDRRELFGLLWAAVEHSVQNWLNPWRPEDVMAKIRRAAEFTQAEDAKALATWSQWQAYLSGASHD